jgi:hypothetical protein
MTHLLAQLRNPVLPPSIGGSKGSNAVGTGGTALGGLLSGVVGALFVAGFLLAFLTLILGGVNWITAGGDKSKLEASRTQITNAVVGLIIVGASYAITTLIANFFGFKLEALPIPTVGQ